MAKYIVFNGSERISCNNKQTALSTLNSLIDAHRDTVASNIAERKARKNEILADTVAAQNSSDTVVEYCYTVYNSTTGSEVANVFVGTIGGNLVLIKSTDGIVTEKYFSSVELDGQVRDFVTYDSDGNPLEYYTNLGGVLTKYNATTNEIMVTTQAGPVPEDKKHKAERGIPIGDPVAWSEKASGFIIEYRKPANKNSASYKNEYDVSFADALPEATSRFHIVEVTLDSNGNEVWSCI